MRDLNKSLIFMFLLVLGLFIMSSFSVVATGVCNEGFRVNVTDTEVIDCHDPCKKVTNGCSDDIFVPTNTSGEWYAFRIEYPSCVSLDECCDCNSNSDPCCDGCNFRPSSYVCNDEYDVEYQCTNNNCGGDLQKRVKERYCSGSSDSCDGYITNWAMWYIDKDCDSTQKCNSASHDCVYDPSCDDDNYPVADFTYSPNNPEVEDTITFDASNSDDPNGFIESYDWDLDDDGSFDDGNGEIITYSFSSSGDHVVGLQVTDDDDVTDSITETIQVSALSVSINSISVSDNCPDENTNIEVNCSSNPANVNCVGASLNGNCIFISWVNNIAVFDCNVGSYTTQTCGSGTSYDAKCFVQLDECDQTGDNKTASVWSLPSDCSQYGNQVACEGDSGCDWCLECDVDGKYSGDVNRCVNSDACTRYCSVADCAADCDSNVGGCGDSYYCDASTQTYYYGNSCNLSDCTCTGYTEEFNNTAYCNNCPTITCDDGLTNCGEECDNGSSLNGNSCTPPYDGSCTYCDSICEEVTLNGGYCGDGDVQPAHEDCDGTNLSGESCVSQDYYSGSLSCNSCDFDTSGCYDNCSLLSVDVNFNEAGPFIVGDSVAINGNIDSDSNCSEATTIQVDANSSDGSCHLEFEGGDMPGITGNNLNIVAGDSSFSGSWTVPSIPSQCAGEIVDGYAAALWSQDPNDGGTGHLDEANSVSGSVEFAVSEIPISNCTELQQIGTDDDVYPLGGDYIQTQDIDCSGISDFASIGHNWNILFYGSFDGSGYSITNLSMSGHETSDQYIGLFRHVGGSAEFNNIHLINANIEGYKWVGGLVGKMESGTISNSYVNGNIECYEEWVGGLVGEMDGTISNSYVNGNVIIHGTPSGIQKYDAGGLVGEMDGTISNSYVNGNVIAEGKISSVGGLVGQMGGTISGSHSSANVNSDFGNAIGGLVGSGTGTTNIVDSYATGSVTGYSEGTYPGAGYYVGGLVGKNTVGTISGSYSTGNVTGKKFVGGLVGWTEGDISDSYSTGNVIGGSHVGGLIGDLNEFDATISDSYSTGSVNCDHSWIYCGGLVGCVAGTPTISNTYWNTETSGQSTSDGGSPRNTSQMTNPFNDPDTYVDWDFSNVWKDDGISGHYPCLKWQDGSCHGSGPTPDPCTLDSVSIIPIDTPSEQGDVVNIFGNISGDCSDATSIQINASSTNLPNSNINSYDACFLKFNVTGTSVNLSGITNESLSIDDGDSSFNSTWTVPYYYDSCFSGDSPGVIAAPDSAALWSGTPGSSNLISVIYDVSGDLHFWPSMGWG